MTKIKVVYIILFFIISCQNIESKNFNESKMTTAVDSLNLIKQSINPIIGKSIICSFYYDSIEIAEHDFPNLMNWEDANKACHDLGDGWLLPDMRELRLILFGSRKIIGGFKEDANYWSSENERLDYAWSLTFNFNGYKDFRPKEKLNRVRAIKRFNRKYGTGNSISPITYYYRLGNSLKLDKKRNYIQSSF